MDDELGHGMPSRSLFAAMMPWPYEYIVSGVDPDLLALVHAAETEPAQQGPASSPTVSRASLQADLAHAQVRNTRLAARIQLLEGGFPANWASMHGASQGW
ncbi:hypothetical protein [Streptomyces sp. NPDC054787]